jgi:PAS domain S-box-containing protein
VGWDPTGDSIAVLHVDDDPDFLGMAARFLRAENEIIDVETETRVDVALERVREGDVDCVVSDYEMPGQDGLEFLDAVREHDDTLPFILYTGRGSEEIASEAISNGVTDYLQKEVGTDQYTVLANRIENAVGKHAAEDLVYRSFRAMDNSREGIALLDEAGHFIYVNETYTDIVGYDRAELIGEFWELVYPEEQIDRIHTDILDSVPREGRWSGDTVYQRKDGSRVLVNHSLVYSDEGTMICLIRDMTDVESQQETLEQERQRFDLFVDAVEDYAIFMLDPDGYITTWNAGAERIKGYTKDEILGQHISTFYTDEQRAAGYPEKLLERAIEEGSVEQEGPRVHKDGSTFRARVTISAIEDDAGSHRGFAKVTRDLSAEE